MGIKIGRKRNTSAVTGCASRQKRSNRIKMAEVKRQSLEQTIDRLTKTCTVPVLSPQIVRLAVSLVIELCGYATTAWE